MAAARRVRVIYEYSYRVGDVGKQVRRGDECVVLCEYDENWLYVCKVDSGAHHMYVPRQFVQPAVSEHDAPATAGLAMSHDEDHARYATMSRLVSASDTATSVRRTRAASTPSARVSNDDGDVQHVMTRGSVISEASDDSDDNDKDYVPFNPTEQSPPPARPAGQPQLDYCNTAPPRARRLHSVDDVLASTGHPSADELKASEYDLSTGHRHTATNRNTMNKVTHCYTGNRSTPFTRYNRSSNRFDNRLYRVNGV